MTTPKLPYANQYTRRHPSRHNAIKKIAMRLIKALPVEKRRNALYVHSQVIVNPTITRKSALELFAAFRLAATE